MEIHGFGGEEFERALEHLRAGEPVAYRGMTLVLSRTAFECRVPFSTSGADEIGSPLTAARALNALIGARFRLGVLLASAPPLDAAVGNRPPRLVLTGDAADGSADLYELRGDRLRKLPGTPNGAG